MNRLNVGDTIRCSDKDDMVSLFMTLSAEGYEPEFCYERGGEKGYWIEIMDVPDQGGKEDLHED